MFFTNITDLMLAYNMMRFMAFRISHGGNWVVSGEGMRTSAWNDGYAAGGTDTYYQIDAVYKNDGTGTLIGYKVEEIGSSDY